MDRRGVEPGAPGVAGGDVGVGLGDADELDLRGVAVTAEEARGVAMHQARHPEPERGGRRSCAGEGPDGQGPEESPALHRPLLAPG